MGFFNILRRFNHFFFFFFKDPGLFIRRYVVILSRIVSDGDYKYIKKLVEGLNNYSLYILSSFQIIFILFDIGR